MTEVAPGIVWDPVDYRIERDGRATLLSARPARIFAELVQHPNQVLPESRRLAVGWPNQVRGRQDLYRQIYMLRTLVEVDRHHPCWLITRRNLGYELHRPRPSSWPVAYMPEVLSLILDRPRIGGLPSDLVI